MSKELFKNYMDGNYDDENGNFDFNEVKFKDAFLTALISELVSNGYISQAKALAEELDLLSSKLLKENKKLFKMLYDNASDKVKKKAYENRLKKIIPLEEEIKKLEKAKKVIETVEKEEKKIISKKIKEKVSPLTGNEENKNEQTNNL